MTIVMRLGDDEEWRSLWAMTTDPTRPKRSMNRPARQCATETNICRVGFRRDPQVAHSPVLGGCKPVGPTGAFADRRYVANTTKSPARVIIEESIWPILKGPRSEERRVGREG